jgi:hypothetical protein
MEKDPIAVLTEVQGYVLHYRNLAASGKYDAEKSRIIRLFADAVETQTRELDREDKL